MNISAHVQNSRNHHHFTLSTNDNVHSIAIPSRPTGYGTSANGGELLFLALVMCYCNDIYREAGKRGIKVTAVEVTVDGDFGAEGEPAQNVTLPGQSDRQGRRERTHGTHRTCRASGRDSEYPESRNPCQTD